MQSQIQGFGIKDDINEIGEEVKNWFKKNKGISKGVDFVRKSGLTQELLGKLPLGQFIGNQLLDKLSNFVQEKGYGISIKDEVENFLLPKNSNEKIGFGIHGLKGLSYDKKLDKIIKHFYDLISIQEKRKDKINEKIENYKQKQLDNEQQIYVQTFKKEKPKKVQKSIKLLEQMSKLTPEDIDMIRQTELLKKQKKPKKEPKLKKKKQ